VILSISGGFEKSLSLFFVLRLGSHTIWLAAIISRLYCSFSLLMEPPAIKSAFKLAKSARKKINHEKMYVQRGINIKIKPSVGFKSEKRECVLYFCALFGRLL